MTSDAFWFPHGFGRVKAKREVAGQVVEFDMAMTGEARGRVETRRFSVADDLRTLHEVGSAPGSAPVRIRCAGVPLLPVDGAEQNASFRVFRAELLSALERKDKAFIRSIVSPNIFNSFGGNGGKAEFEKYSQLDDVESWFWTEFGAVLRMGGVSPDPDSFAAPYPSTEWPAGLDAFMYVAVIGRDVNVRAKPSRDSLVVGKVGFQTLPVVGTPEPRSEWTYVSLDDGRVGYVHRSLVRSAIGYRAQFSRRDGRWWLDSFVAGD